MTPAMAEVRSWSVRRWVLIVAVLFIGQLFLLINFGRRGEPLPSVESFPIRIRITDALSQSDGTSSALAWPDPTLFALPHRPGFSGEAWLSPRPMQYRLSPWSEPPRWFEFEEAHLKTPMAAYLPTNAPSPLLALKPRLPNEAGTTYVPPAAAPTESALEISGDLTSAQNVPVLPAWPSTDLLSNTVVRIVVQASGSVFSAAILAESGSLPADQFALRVAKVLQFSRTPADPSLRRALLRFKWRTLPAPVAQESQASKDVRPP